MLALQMATYEVADKQVVDEDALYRLKRDYLPQWAALAYGSAVGKGLPSEVPYVDYMKPSVSMGGADDEPDHEVCNTITLSIDEITKKIPYALAALCVRYVRNANGPKVFRSGRIEAMAQGTTEDIADQAEIALVPVCRRRGLPL